MKDELEAWVDQGVLQKTETDEGIQYILPECFVAGFRYSDGPDIMSYLQSGEKLTLIAEPGNPHDDWAVRVEHKKSRVGYVPRSINRIVSLLLQRDIMVQAVIVQVQPSGSPWECIRMRIMISLPT